MRVSIPGLVLLISILSSSAVAVDKAPDFSLKNMAGKKFVLSDALRDGPVLLDFWATWCKPCLKALPHLDMINQTYADSNLQVYAVSIDNPRSQSKVKPYIKGKKYTFGVLLDPDQEARKLFGGTSVPLTVLIVPSGEVIYKHLGYITGDEKKLVESIEGMFRSSQEVDSQQKSQ